MNIKNCKNCRTCKHLQQYTYYDHWNDVHISLICEREKQYWIDTEDKYCDEWEYYGNKKIKGIIKKIENKYYRLKENVGIFKNENSNMNLFESYDLEGKNGDYVIYKFSIADYDIDEINEEHYIRLEGELELELYDNILGDEELICSINGVNLNKLLSRYLDKHIVLEMEKVTGYALPGWYRYELKNKKTEKKEEEEVEQEVQEFDEDEFPF